MGMKTKKLLKGLLVNHNMTEMKAKNQLKSNFRFSKVSTGDIMKMKEKILRVIKYT